MLETKSLKLVRNVDINDVMVVIDCAKFDSNLEGWYIISTDVDILKSEMSLNTTANAILLDKLVNTTRARAISDFVCTSGYEAVVLKELGGVAGLRKLVDQELAKIKGSDVSKKENNVKQEQATNKSEHVVATAEDKGSSFANDETSLLTQSDIVSKNKDTQGSFIEAYRKIKQTPSIPIDKKNDTKSINYGREEVAATEKDVNVSHPKKENVYQDKTVWCKNCGRRNFITSNLCVMCSANLTKGTPVIEEKRPQMKSFVISKSPVVVKKEPTPACVSEPVSQHIQEQNTKEEYVSTRESSQTSPTPEYSNNIDAYRRVIAELKEEIEILQDSVGMNTKEDMWTDKERDTFLERINNSTEENLKKSLYVVCTSVVSKRDKHAWHLFTSRVTEYLNALEYKKKGGNL